MAIIIFTIRGTTHGITLAIITMDILIIMEDRTGVVTTMGIGMDITMVLTIDTIITTEIQDTKVQHTQDVILPEELTILTEMVQGAVPEQARAML